MIRFRYLATLFTALILNFTSLSRAQSAAPPLELLIPSVQIGDVEHFIHFDDQHIFVIDVWDGKYFFTTLVNKQNNYEISKRYYLADTVTTFNHYKDVKTGELVIALGMSSGKLKLFNVNKHEPIADLQISSHKIDSIKVSKYVSDGAGQLLISSGGKLGILDYLNNFEITLFNAGSGSILQGSFSQAQVKEVLFADGTIYTHPVDGVRKVTQLDTALFDGTPIYAFDEDSDEIDEIYTKRGTKGYPKLGLFSAKENKYLWDVANVSESALYHFRGFTLLPNRTKPTAIFSKFEYTIYENARYAHDLCLLTPSLTLSDATVNCYNQRFLFFRNAQKVVNVNDFNGDGKLDLFSAFSSSGNRIKMGFENLPYDETYWDVNGFPTPDLRCKGAEEIDLRRSSDKHALYCIGYKEWPQGTRYGTAQFWQNTDIKTGELLTSDAYLSTYSPSKFFEAFDDVSGDFKDDEFRFSGYYVNGADNKRTLSLGISVLSSESYTSGLGRADLEDKFDTFPNKAIYSAKDRAWYFQFPSNAVSFRLENEVNVLDKEKQFVGTSRAAFKGKEFVVGLANDGALYAINTVGEHTQLHSVCKAGEAVSLNEVSPTTLVFSCRGYFGLYNMISNTIEWQYSDPYHDHIVIYKKLEEQGYFYTLSNLPAVYMYNSPTIEPEVIEQQTLDVHIGSTLDIRLSDQFPGQHYVIEHHPYRGELRSVDLESGLYQYKPEKIGKEYISYQVVKDDLIVATGSFILESYNNAPEASNVEKQIHWRGESMVSLAGQDKDSETITYEIVSQPNVGKIVRLDPQTGLVMVSPSDTDDAAIVFDYRVLDSLTSSEPAVVTLNITNTTPVAHSKSVAVKPSEAIEFVLDANDKDGDPLTYVLTTDVVAGSLELDQNTGKVKFTAPAEKTEQLYFEYYVTDTRSQSTPQRVDINIESVDNGDNGDNGDDSTAKNPDNDKSQAPISNVEKNKNSSGSFAIISLLAIIISLRRRSSHTYK
ncbi:hypothetical protein PA25_15450 [Pseudoalteromonas sp. A25]|uniref:Ig-like domain-containing protein n=1 Tax=Pseudoalteromonas sp. A25 TaxID=116092 RepID=UPI001260CFB2|nr:Ig-like domain-containing protein [Pseudoalteromonas sp. A25]BBN81560.1 hypothetical protein PA25_15450 [Pseudoalteromonas sp. A25]